MDCKFAEVEAEKKEVTDEWASLPIEKRLRNMEEKIYDLQKLSHQHFSGRGDYFWLTKDNYSCE